MMKAFWGAVILAIGVLGCSPAHFVIPGRDLDPVHLFLRLPEAGRVEFASSADQFRIHDVGKNADGIWEIKVPFKSEFRYFYKVDGVLYTPDCPYRETDDFGSQNCIYTPEKR